MYPLKGNQREVVHLTKVCWSMLKKNGVAEPCLAPYDCLLDSIWNLVFDMGNCRRLGVLRGKPLPTNFNVYLGVGVPG